MALGVASRWIDTAAWAPAWIGLVITPWLVAPWLAGAWTSSPNGILAWGAAAGFALLAATVAAYLAVAGSDSAPMLPGLLVLAVTAGPLYGAAGACLHRGGRGRLLAASALGAALIAEGLLLQLGERSPFERVVFAVESAAGVVLATWMAGSRAGLLALATGIVLLAIELAVLATIGPGLP
jgi:hypothetical protein